MSGKFNPFHSKEAEVLRTHSVAKRKKALKLFEKLQRKRPYVWAEVQEISSAAEQTLNALSGEISVALFVDATSSQSAWPPSTPALDALITRLWKNFNKLHIIRLVEEAEEKGLDQDEE